MSETMTIDHADMVKILAKDPKEILDTFNLQRFMRVKNTLKLLVDDGAMTDRLKKEVIYNKEGTSSKSIWNASANDKQAYYELTPEKMHMLHMLMGIVGEAAELIEPLFNYIFENADLDLKNIIEELGDIEFYTEGLRQPLQVSRATVLDANISKLAERYKGFVYSDEAAHNRADKA